MNIISKIIAIAPVVLLCGCPQGPWDFWPKDPELYRGIWTTAHVVSGKPIRDVCFEPVIPLHWTRTPFFAFYDSAAIEISGRFSGTELSISLIPRANRPNCFEGPDSLIAEAGATYRLRAFFVWDSAGQTVRSAFSASTTIPVKFKILGLRSPALTRPADMLRDSSLLNTIQLAINADPRALPETQFDSLIGENQLTLWGITKNIRYTVRSGDTVRNLKPPLDLQSHFVISEYSPDVRGALITLYFDSTQGKPATSFTFFGGFQPDSATQWEKGNRHRLLFIPNQRVPNGDGFLLDSLSLSNAYLYAGKQTFYFYGSEQSYLDYIANSVQGVNDSRVRPKGNILGGEGIFAGLVMDSLNLFLKPYPKSLVFPYPITKIMGCRKLSWFNESFPECRTYLEEFCADSLNAVDCRIHAVARALDSGYTWDSLMLPTRDSAQADSVFREGAILHCLRVAFSDSVACATPREQCLVAPEKNLCKIRAWQYCADRDWPLSDREFCGNALVSWVRLNQKASSTLDRVVRNWCTQHPKDRQCALR